MLCMVKHLVKMERNCRSITLDSVFPAFLSGVELSPKCLCEMFATEATLRELWLTLGPGLIRCMQASPSDAAHVWMTMEDQWHYTPHLGPAFRTQQITSPLLIYGNHLQCHGEWGFATSMPIFKSANSSPLKLPGTIMATKFTTLKNISNTGTLSTTILRCTEILYLPNVY